MKLSEVEKWKIKRLRKGITLTQLADTIDYDRSTLSKFELGLRVPKQHIWEQYKEYVKNYASQK